MNEIRYENSWGGRMKEHIKWVDCVKVEACILVVIGHGLLIKKLIEK